MKYIPLFALILWVVSCTTVKKEDIQMPYTKADFEKVVNGKQTTLFTLKNDKGMVVTLTNYGAKIVSIYVPGKDGKFEDVVMGFKSIDEYVNGDAGQGAVVGPYANRIAGASFEIDGVKYPLEVNNHNANLHSGSQSFYRQVYDAKEIVTDKGPAVEMFLASPDSASGFPGNKEVKVTYTLTAANELIINYEATTDKPCFFNLTNHSYFNLKGEGMGDILDHILIIDSDSTTAVANNELIPTGEIVSIKGTDMDFTSPHKIGERINSEMEPIKVAGGYDHNYILNKNQNAGELTFCASVYEETSGRFMEVFTTEPAVQLYTGNFLKGDMIGKRGNKYEYRNGMCLETQHYPDSPHHANFPNTLVRPGEVLSSQTIFKFSVK